MQDYKPNSHRFKEEQKTVEREKVKKVVKGTVKTKKKGEIRKFAENFIAEDVNNIKSYVISEVLIPTIKNTIWDAFTNSLDMILYHGDGRRGKSSPRNAAHYVSYNSYSDSRNGRRDPSTTTRTGYSLDDITLETRGEAEEVLRQLDDIIDMYGMARVADLYDLVGITGRHTDNKYGWTNLHNAEAVRVRDGYKLKLPRVLPID